MFRVILSSLRGSVRAAAIITPKVESHGLGKGVRFSQEEGFIGVTANDGEIAFTGLVKPTLDDSPFKPFYVNPVRFLGWLDTLPDCECEFELEGSTLHGRTITDGKTSKIHSELQFPVEFDRFVGKREMPQTITGDGYISCECDQLLSALDIVHSVSTSQGAKRSSTIFLQVEGNLLRMSTVTSATLTSISIPIVPGKGFDENEFKFSLDPDAVDFMASRLREYKSGVVTLLVDRVLRASFGTVNMFAIARSGTRTSVDKFIPAEADEFYIVDRNKLLSAIRCTEKFITKDQSRTQLNFAPGKLVVEYDPPGKNDAKSSIEVECEGFGEFSISLDPALLGRCLRGLSCESVRFDKQISDRMVRIGCDLGVIGIAPMVKTSE